MLAMVLHVEFLTCLEFMLDMGLTKFVWGVKYFKMVIVCINESISALKLDL